MMENSSKQIEHNCTTIFYQVERWLSESEIKKVEYSSYWNDEKEELNKEWYILDGNFSKMERYLQETGLVKNLKQCVKKLKTDFNRELTGTGIDLAAGNLWAVPYLLELGKIDKLYCLEYSKHRLLKIGPEVLKHYKVPKEKVVLVLGNFYDIKLKDHSLNFVFLSSALHHAREPEKLLSEIRRILNPNGIVIIIGEPVAGYWKTYPKYFIKFFISRLVPDKIQHRLFGRTFEVKSFPKLCPKFSELFPTDPISGDHFYSIKEYNLMFSKFRFTIKHVKNFKSKFQSFILIGNR